ncbi:branched-chain amino acid ABC transporter permease [Aeromicrobium alkaliterrae]|uniref:Branched-chain amino acid ABC transporter permease n=1 Tax=Aeromicrobium alkaliterrae TaxID=302168 RepID=A0ABP4WD41_9ACTN
MELFAQRVVDGLSDGAIYAIVALALVLVYRSTRLLNFAQGEMGMFCAFITWQLSTAAGGPQIALPLAIVVGIVAGFVMGAGIERVVMRPFSSGDHLRMTMVTMGLLLVINALAAHLFSTTTQRLESPFGQGSIDLGGFFVSRHTVGVLVTLLAVSLALWILFTRTTVGISLRASSSNAESSRLLGVNVDRSLMLGWGLAGALGALAAILVAPTLYLSTTMMSTVTLYAFTAAVVGGLDSSIGAVVGGLGIGLVQSLASGYIPFIGTQLQLATALIVVLVALLARPQGLFGRPQLERV